MGLLVIGGLGSPQALVTGGFGGGGVGVQSSPATATILTRGLGAGARLLTRGYAAPGGDTSSIEQAVVARLSGDATLAAAIGTRILPHVIPQARKGTTTLPAVTYQLLDDLHDHDLKKAAGIARARVRLEARSRTFADAVAIAERARMVLDGYRGMVGPVSIQFTKVVDQGSGYDSPDDDSDAGTHLKFFVYKFTYRVSIPTF